MKYFYVLQGSVRILKKLRSVEKRMSKSIYGKTSLDSEVNGG
jgi:hypothetical protein